MITFGQQPPAPRAVSLGRGVAVTLRTLDSRTHARIFARVDRELNALVEDRETKHDWGFAADEIAALGDDEDARAAAVRFMRSVLVADAAAVSVDGVEDEAGAPVAPSFALFAWLFADSQMEALFRLQITATEQIWTDEGNASGRGPRGDGATEPLTAADAAPSSRPASPAASPTATTDSPANAAPSTSTPLAPTKATSPGASPATPEAGATPG